MKNRIVLLSILFIGFLGCKKKNKELPAPEAAAIEVTALDGNTFIVRNATPTGGAGSLWDFGDLGTSTQYSDTLFFAYAGTYPISLTSNSKGGIAKTTATITVDKTSVYASDFSIEKVDSHHFKITVTTPNTEKRLLHYSSIGMDDTTEVTTAYFPFSGDHEISLTVWVKGVPLPSTLKKTVTVDSDDMSNPDLEDDFYKILTGGLADIDGRTWVIDPTPGLSGTGAYNRKRIDLLFWDYTKEGGYLGNPAWTDGALKNEFTFIMRNYQFIPKNTSSTVNWLVADEIFGIKNPENKQYIDISREDPNLKSASFIVKNEKIGITGYTLKFNNETYLGFFQNRFGYEIAKISATEDSVWVRQKYNDNVNVPYAERHDPTKDVAARTMLLVMKK